MAKDYYAVLGLARGADDVVVHAAWKALLRKYHPDTNADAAAQARARDINEAFSVLGKPQERAAYDRSHAPPHPGPAYRPAPPQYRPPYQPQYRAPVRRARPRRRIAAALLLLATVPAAILLLDRYPDALPDLRDRLRSYADFDTPSLAAFLPAAFIPSGLRNGTATPTAPAAVAQPPPPIDPAIVSAATRRALAVVRKGGMPAAASVSRQCDAAAQDWPQLDDCIAFNVAVSLVEATTLGTLGTPDPYFALATQRDFLRVEQRDQDAIRADNRVAGIRALVAPQVIAALVAQVGTMPHMVARAPRHTPAATTPAPAPPGAM